MQNTVISGRSVGENAERIAVSARRRCVPAFTVLELLVVIVVISILVGAILTGSTLFINSQKSKNTQTVLLHVRDALEQFKSDQTSKPTVTRVVQGTASYSARYGMYPPDELEVFTPYGLPGATAGGKYSLAGPNTNTQPECTANSLYPDMNFYTTGKPEDDQFEHRDLAAMVLAIELFSESANQILSRIPERNWSKGAVDVAGKPVQFLDRAPLDASFGEGDEQIRYVLDDWQVPLSYLAQRDWVADPTVAKPQTADSSNLRDHRWHRASTEMIRLNGGRPIIFSYGPDGKEQLSKTWMMPTGGKASLVADWTSKDNPGKIDDPLNADNVYADPALAEKLAKGSP